MKKYYYCIFFAIIEMLTGNFLYAFDKKIITDELSTLTYDRLIVYGTKTCSYTNSMRGYLAQNRIQYIFKDIDNHAGAESEMWDIVYNSSWFTSGSVSLPIVAVNDIAYERPSTTTVSFLLNSGNGIVNHELTGIVSGEVRLESVNGEGVQAEIDLFNISSSGEFYHICYSDSQGVYECNGVIPGEYKIIIKRNGIINEQQFLNGYVQNGQIFSVKEKETVDAMNTVVFEKNVAKKYIRKLPSSNPDSLLWSHPDSKTNNYIYYMSRPG
jgi:glutaredoxin